MRIIDAILDADRVLRSANVSETPRLEAEVLLGDVLHRDRAKLISSYPEALNERDIMAFMSLVRRRADGEPLAYITGKKEFMGRVFQVDRRVLIPRPETEILVEYVSEYIRDAEHERPHILDIGTGCGCIAVSLALDLPQAIIYATDISEAALEIAKTNAAEYYVAERITFLYSDIYAGIPENLKESFDFIVSNPPYVSDSEYVSLERTVRDFEPPIALRSGRDGLDCFRRIVAGAAEHLLVGGLLAVEIGEHQSEKAAAILERTGLSVMEIVPDLAGKLRVIIGRRMR